MDRSIAFYADVLSFTKTSDRELLGGEYERLQGVFGLRMRVVRMELGDESLELTEYLTPQGRPMPPDSRGNDLWFQHVAVIVSDMDRAFARLREHRVRFASTGPQLLPPYLKAAGISAFYFRDPDGHFLEILHFPPDKGDAKWHRGGDVPLFLGIDHTAIVVSDTAASLRLYGEALGLRVAGEAENWGTEQEHLNNVFGARLRITTMRAGSGPGIEFLEYLAPRDGRPAPADLRSNDIAHWQTRLVTASLGELAGRLRQAGYAFVSPGVIEVPEPDPGFRRGVLVKDPDGHVMQFVEGEP
jgi:catechol 2,3-dioxygenase-like lactoylglutathione lyase family enzyme